MRRRPAVGGYAVLLGALGAAFLLVPGRIWRVVTGQDSTRVQTLTVRVLGARQLIQAAAVVARPGNAWVDRAPAVDGLHATSMVALAALSPRYRRPAGVSAIAATVCAVAGVLALRHNPPSRKELR